jgi:hypothetical protein
MLRDDIKEDKWTDVFGERRHFTPPGFYSGAFFPNFIRREM